MATRYHYAFPGAVSVLAVALAASGGAPPEESNSIGMTLVRIEPGSFDMGVDSTPLPEEMLSAPKGTVYDRPADGDYDEAPVHKVTITRPFLIGATEVTIEQFRQYRPSFQGDPYYAPYASGLSWYDGAAFCQWLSQKEGKTYRLPTEAEWEYACRAGTRTPFSSGTRPPAPETPNGWGVKNMHTGVAEWCLDWHGLYPRTPQTDPLGPLAGLAKVVRGGGLDYRPSKDDGGKRMPAELPYYARSANRAGVAPGFAAQGSNIGFRVVQASQPDSRMWSAGPLFFQTGVKQGAIEVRRGPDASKPYYHTRPLFPNIGDRPMRTVGWKIGLPPGLGVAYHNSAVQMCPNGDLLAAYYNTPQYEDDPDQTVLIMRLRYGAEDWDMPEPWPDFPDAADAAPVIWNDRGKLWMFWGSPRLLAGPPFQYVISTDNGASWGVVQFPRFETRVGDFTAQPINSVVRAADGTIYLPVDGKGGTSVLFATHDNGRTWYDTGGRTAGRHTTLVIGKDGSLIGYGGKNTNIDGFMPKAISRDGGKTYEKSKTQFMPLGSGQRPSLIRLESGRLFFVADYNHGKAPGPTRPGAFVALSDDDGQTWKTRDLPGLTTAGYVTATQVAGGLIHIVTSKNKPDFDIELNEAWVLEGGAPTQLSTTLHDVRSYRESYAGTGDPKVEWRAGISEDNRYLLDGRQTFYYMDGHPQWEASYAAGRKTGTETFWAPGGKKKWEKIYEADGAWVWHVYDENGRLIAESRWNGKNLVDYRVAK